MHDYLKKLLENKRAEVNQLKAQLEQDQAHPIHAILNGDKIDLPKKSFKRALGNHASIIAEIKKKSPSKNHLADIPDPVTLAKRYVAGGASAISVLTDSYGFDGSMDDLKRVSTALSDTNVPILQKDFIVDPVQIAEAISAGADAVLLIVAVLKENTKDLLKVAKSLGVDAMVEVVNQEELDFSLSVGAEIIDVNNRDLTTFVVDPNRALELIPSIPDSIASVAASGMDSPETAAIYLRAGYNAVLVGEALVKSGDPEQFIKRFRELV